MTRSKFFIFIIIILIISNVLLLGFILNKKPNRISGPKQLIIERLHFDKEQIQKFEALILPHQKAIRENRDQIHSAKRQLYSQISLPSTEQNKDSLITAISSSQREIEMLHYNHFRDIKEICREDQLDDFKKLSKDLSSMFAGRGPRSKR